MKPYLSLMTVTIVSTLTLFVTTNPFLIGLVFGYGIFLSVSMVLSVVFTLVTIGHLSENPGADLRESRKGIEDISRRYTNSLMTRFRVWVLNPAVYGVMSYGLYLVGHTTLAYILVFCYLAVATTVMIVASVLSDTEKNKSS